MSDVIMGGGLLCYIFLCPLLVLNIYKYIPSLQTKIMVSCLFLPLVECFPAPNITCKDLHGNETHFTGKELGFRKPISCRNV